MNVLIGLAALNIVYLNMFVGTCLRCHCNPCPEYAVNDTCRAEPESKCYVAVTYAEDTQVETWTWGCLASDESSIMQVCKFLIF